MVWSSTAFTYTHQKTITVNDDESYISTGNFDTAYYATSRDYGVFDTDAKDVAAIVAVFNADYAHTFITPSDADDLGLVADRLGDPAPQLDQRGDQTLDIEAEEFSAPRRERARLGREARCDRPDGPRRPLGLLIRSQRHRGGRRGGYRLLVLDRVRRPREDDHRRLRHVAQLASGLGEPDQQLAE